MSGDDGIMPLFCPTHQVDFVKSVDAGEQAIKIAITATVHGVVFAVLL
ncbi:hypothetical protein [Bradyrhizobium sp. WSM3983]|nr:hypothetical protein [Bradyrhizobium sp. WSM3983]